MSEDLEAKARALIKRVTEVPVALETHTQTIFLDGSTIELKNFPILHCSKSDLCFDLNYRLGLIHTYNKNFSMKIRYTTGYRTDPLLVKRIISTYQLYKLEGEGKDLLKSELEILEEQRKNMLFQRKRELDD